MKSDENKIKALGPHLAMAYGGEPGDTNNFADFVERNLRLFHIRYVTAFPSTLRRRSGGGWRADSWGTEITLLSYHRPPPLGSAAHWPSHCDPENPTPSTSSSRATTRRQISLICTGSTTSAPKRWYRTPHMVWVCT